MPRRVPRLGHAAWAAATGALAAASAGGPHPHASPPEEAQHEPPVRGKNLEGPPTTRGRWRRHSFIPVHVSPPFARRMNSVMCRSCSVYWLLLVAAACSGCGHAAGKDSAGNGLPGTKAAASTGSDTTPAPLSVVCTTGQVADMLENIGGSHVKVVALMGAGVDPHLYKATPGDIRRLKRADVIFYSGLHLEGRLAAILEKLAEKKPAVAVTEGVREHQPRRLLTAPQFADVTTRTPGSTLACGPINSMRRASSSSSIPHAANRENADRYVAQIKGLGPLVPRADPGNTREAAHASDRARRVWLLRPCLWH